MDRRPFRVRRPFRAGKGLHVRADARGTHDPFYGGRPVRRRGGRACGCHRRRGRVSPGHLRAVRGAGAVRARLRRGARRRGSEHALLGAGDRAHRARIAGRGAHDPHIGHRVRRARVLGIRRAATCHPSRAGGWRGEDLLRADRAERRLGHLRHLHDGVARRRWLHHQRRQDIHHERSGGRLVHRVRARGGGRAVEAVVLHRAPRHARPRDRPQGGQDGLARLSDLPAVLREHARGTRSRGGRGGRRVRHRAPHAEPRPLGRGGAGHRRDGRLARGRGRLCEGAHPVRKAYRGLAGHPLHAGRYGDHAGSVPLAVGPGGIGVRRRHPDDDEDGVGGEGVLLGGGGESG